MYAGHTHFKREGEKTRESRDYDLVQQMYDSIENLFKLTVLNVDKYERPS